MVFYKDTKKAGFTLIELLIVIAIIGLLTAITLSYLGESRDKSRNSAKNQMVYEYIKAFEIYRANNLEEGYPNENATSTYCLGSSVDNCTGPDFDFPHNDSLNSKISEYIAGPPVDTFPIPFNDKDMRGISYACSVSTDPCSEYRLTWFLKGKFKKLNCIKGALKENFANIGARCTFTSE